MRWRFAAIVFLVSVSWADAATGGSALLVSTNTPIEATADSLEYSQSGSILKATGHVVIKSGTNQLSADRVTAKLDSREMWATGHVVFTQGSNAWTGEKLYCNMESGLLCADGTNSEFTVDPFHGLVRGGFRKLGDTVTGSDAMVTTCNLPYPGWHYCLKAARATLVEDRSISVTHGFFYLAGIPVLYVPYWEKSADGNGISLVPGYSSSMGAYLLTSYDYGMTDVLRGSTRLDYRTRRGLAFGQDLSWTGANRSWSGGLELYGMRDDDPLIDRDPSISIGENRYRMLLFHNQAFADRTRLLTRIHYLSDAYMLDDFFRSEYRLEPQPDNFVSFTHLGEDYTAGLSFRPRLNDFYDAVARIPEVQLEFPLQQLADSRFYYESQTAAGYLERLWAAGNTNASYAAFRLDSRQSISSPLRIGFLNFVPRVAARGTYYSATPATATEVTDGGSAFRTMCEAGAQLSFKLFKTYIEATETDGGLRHVAEPYANYTYIPDPNLGPADLYSFDDVDTLGGQNGLRLGVRNKLQVKRNGQPFDLVDLNTWVDGNFNAGTNENTFGFLYMDARLRPWHGVSLDCDGKFSLDRGTAEELNTHLVVKTTPAISTDMEYRFLRDQSSLLCGKFTYSPSERWSYTYAARYEIRDSRLEEHSLWIQRNYDCMCVAIGLNQIPSYTRTDGTVQEDEYQGLFKMWLKAFPKFGISTD